MEKRPVYIKDICMNREYSWMLFNERVLDQATDNTNPLLERCKFLSIFHSNFDEFFMVRVGSLINDAKLNPAATDNKTGLTAREQVACVMKTAKRSYRAADGVYVKLKKELAANGLRIKKGTELSAKQYQKCKKIFEAQVLPLLSPMVLDAKHPLMRFENMNCYMVFELTKSDRLMYGVMAISPKIPRVFELTGSSSKRTIITAEELIRTFGGLAFDGYKIQSRAMLRLTRNADFDASLDDADIERDFDFSKFLKRKIELRGTQDAVRLQIDKGADSIKAFILKALNVKKAYCFEVKHNFDHRFLLSLGAFMPDDILPSLKYKLAKPLPPPVPDGSLIEAVMRRDIFLAYPFDSMDTLVRLLDECADDGRVASIKITIYRLDSHSRIVEALKKASENGKDVTVVIELCARFDEENNLHFSEVLKEAGCTIIYGMGNYKVHSKIISIVLTDGDEIKYITHLGTGNYNENTSKLYTDLNIITSDDGIGRDGVAFFRNIAICNIDHEYEKLLIAPRTLKTGMISYIERETQKAKSGKPARIIAKMNSLTDRAIIDKLVNASKAGVKIDLIIRGICCIVPGVPGKTDNIRVRSIVGRFLEHSRIYCFGEGDDRALFIASADLMTRNTDKRVEIATPVLDTRICDRIAAMLDVMLSDNVKARELDSEGNYAFPKAKGEPINCQELFLRGKFAL